MHLNRMIGPHGNSRRCLWSVVDPGLAPFPHFFLPDGDDLFQPVDGIFASLEGHLAVWRADGDGDTALAHFEVPDAVEDGDVIDRPFLAYFVGHLLHLTDRHLP